jgi:hypothetical protein
MPKAKPLKKEDIIAAMGMTKSVRSAARYLNCSYHHLKRWMKLYDGVDGQSLFEQHKNPAGKGIPKFTSNSPFSKKEPAILDIVEGRVDPSYLNPQKIKYRLIESGYLKEECNTCGFHERRVIDYKMPLILHFKNGNKQHYTLNNLQMLCYNCYFLYVNSIFTEKEIENMEDHVPHNGSGDIGEKLQIDEYTQKRLDELGIFGSDKNDDPYNLVSYK